MALEVELLVSEGGGRRQLASELDIALGLGGRKIRPGRYKITIERIPDTRTSDGVVSSGVPMPFRTTVGTKIHLGIWQRPETPNGGVKAKAACGATFMESEAAFDSNLSVTCEDCASRDA